MPPTTPDPTPEPPAVTAARRTVDALVAHGVQDVVLAPGSRSAPLAYALAAADDAGRLRLHVRVDERSAGFLALGLARGATLRTGRPTPAAVVTTSGTAAANVHPAVLEAHHAQVPLVVLTADRPHELRRSGANQTTDQVGLYGSAVRDATDVPAPDGRTGETRDLRATLDRVLAAARGVRSAYPGPVHLNLAYREPLTPPAGVVPSSGAGTSAVLPPDVPGSIVVEGIVVEVAGAGHTSAGLTSVEFTNAGHASAEHPGAPSVVLPDDVPPALVATGPDEPPTVVVAGDGAGPEARALAEARGWPLLAEASSGAAGGTHAIAVHRIVLDVLGPQVRRAVVLGRPTLSRPVQALLARDDVATVVVAPGAGPWPDASRTAALVLPGIPAAWGTGTGAPAPWLATWRRAGKTARDVVLASTTDTNHTTGTTTTTGATTTTGVRTTGPAAADGVAVARAVVDACGPDDVLVVGSSNPVRDLDLVVGDTPPVVLANRGLAGIDGTIATATGVALASGRRTRALVGDLTFLHDAGSLLRGPLEPAADLTVVVVNDDGGSIFSTLEQGALAGSSPTAARTFERVFGTPHGADLAALCAGYGVRHDLADDAAAVSRLAAGPPSGTRVIEVRVTRDDRRERGRALADAVRRAVRTATGQDS
ncbi:2-succinyl-5-enolpyruvyl-6-hydroxy-3-cyclohexene-1-carboxylic-acid synthase [Sediminihabitans luteus]|uniref:2-succinyl-5-enolpyruvyl-6-hydroxy-3- cyclohexene-1-carboxylic-acid synthase n=1 Tax=Sediminihabitans luteus TaxID=1138585 RepID=UPI000C23BE60|nr:2-succinyl-5-enolpyruvyl-6-hydroxy-3-cyclohexene-1-carboxylic-acid synthase [Sediminihabitans luteus]